MSEKVVKMEQQNDMYRLEEMVEAMHQSIANAEDVRDEQIALIEIMRGVQNEIDENASTSVHDWSEFISGLEKQVDQINNSITELNSRIIAIEACIAACKDNAASTRAVQLLIEGLGVFSNRG